METTVKQRLIKFLHSENLSQRRFEIIIGLSNGYVNNINKSIQPDKIQSIALNFPNLNTGWLLTGEGSMLKSETVSAPKEVYINNNIDYKEKWIELLEENIRLNKKIELLTDELCEIRKQQAESKNEKPNARGGVKVAKVG
jgi:transcriptional regulator with XRE-family HTH domain